MKPIGIFDSGVGGLSVWREIVRQLPNESTLYLADQAHVPYGPRPLEEIQQYAKGITAFLLEQGAKLIVVACNTASGAALHALRDTFPDTPFVGMEPAVKPAAEQTRSGVIGVIATPATFQGDLFQTLVKRFAAQVQLKTQICPRLVEVVEAGETDAPATEMLLRSYLTPMVQAGIDHLVLGCTHYPFLSETIARVVGPDITLVDPAPAVARQVKRLLAQHGLKEHGTEPPRHQLYTTGDNQAFTKLARQLVDYQDPVLTAIWHNGKTLHL